MIVHDIPQGVDEWYRLRSGMPTASQFKRLVTDSGAESTSMLDYAIELAAQKYAGKNVDGFPGNKYTERGSELEAEACADYEMVQQIEVNHVGFITNNLMQYGCSPDGLVGNDGGVEFKCKIAKEHVKALFYYQKTGKIPSEYYAQPQGCMLVTGRKWWDFVLYHPELPGLTVRQYPDKPFLKTLRKQLKAVEAERNIIVEQLNKL